MLRPLHKNIVAMPAEVTSTGDLPYSAKNPAEVTRPAQVIEVQVSAEEAGKHEKSNTMLIAFAVVAALIVIGAIVVIVAVLTKNDSCKLITTTTARTINIGSLYQSFHLVEAAGVDYVLQKRGFKTKFIIDKNYNSLFGGLFTGKYDMIPSVWLPSGHASFLKGKLLNKDYVIAGQQSELDLFFFMGSAAVSLSSIDDLADPVKTVGYHPEIYFSAGPQTGLNKGSVKIIDEINKMRKVKDPSAFSFTYNNVDFDSAVKAKLFNLLDANNKASTTSKFIVSWFAPWWGYDTYINSGSYKQLSNGVIGAKHFGLPNRAVTITTPKFLQSGVIDIASWNAISTLFLGSNAVSKMDLLWKNDKNKTKPEYKNALDVFSAYVHQPENAGYAYFINSSVALRTGFAAPAKCGN